jgi:uncharacterized protein (TIGR02646 family)
VHKLDRTAEAACLACYDYHVQNWDDVRQADKHEIRSCLAHMQDDRSAYCEGPLYSRGHIEHFRRKNPRHFPELTFDWSNRFLSCDGGDNSEHCGHYKDHAHGDPYDPADLVKPDEHDPDAYFYFHSSGEVRPRSRISGRDISRAAETIRVFNLNSGVLRPREGGHCASIRIENPISSMHSWDSTSRLATTLLLKKSKLLVGNPIGPLFVISSKSRIEIHPSRQGHSTELSSLCRT